MTTPSPAVALVIHELQSQGYIVTDISSQSRHVHAVKASLPGRHELVFICESDPDDSIRFLTNEQKIEIAGLRRAIAHTHMRLAYVSGPDPEDIDWEEL